LTYVNAYNAGMAMIALHPLQRLDQGEMTMANVTRYDPFADVDDLTDVDETACTANYKDGVLELVLPKKTGAGVRQINVT